VNDWVEVGDTIGYVGDSGNAKGTPPHVHYGIYIQGRAVNPYPLLVKD
ncbi:MAG: M23 family metallopeptidase, partial [Psychrobacter sp.]